jgi:hypothetical protein
MSETLPVFKFHPTNAEQRARDDGAGCAALKNASPLESVPACHNNNGSGISEMMTDFFYFP